MHVPAQAAGPPRRRWPPSGGGEANAPARARSWTVASGAVWLYKKCQMAAGESLTTRRLVSALGGRRALRSSPEDLDALRLRLRQGLPYQALAALTSAYDIDLRSLALVLRIPQRTLARRRQERRLRPDESDRLFRVARIAALAEESLGGRDRAARWLKRPNRALGNAIPLQHLDTDLGSRQVEDVLGRISHGIYS